MWLSKQQKRPAEPVREQTGVVTVSGSNLSVRLDSEVSAPDLYGPAGYRWMPAAGDRVLVLKGEGERPCVIGVKKGGTPAAVALEAEQIGLNGQVMVNGTALEDYVRALAREVWEELG